MTNLNILGKLDNIVDLIIDYQGNFIKILFKFDISQNNREHTIFVNVVLVNNTLF